MISRRDLLVIAPCVAAAGAAVVLEPRREMSILGKRKLADIVPAAFAGWTSRNAADLVAPATEGGLTAKLYDETLSRIYQHDQSGAFLMLMLAHGPKQTNELQIHRPEVCYPAFGFALKKSAIGELPLSGGAAVPVRMLVAEAQQHLENVVYWTRLGEYFPIDGKAQRLARLETAMDGLVADGLLARFSVIDDDSEAAWAQAKNFAGAMVLAMAPQDRAALIGTARATALQRSGV